MTKLENLDFFRCVIMFSLVYSTNILQNHALTRCEKEYYELKDD